MFVEILYALQYSLGMSNTIVQFFYTISCIYMQWPYFSCTTIIPPIIIIAFSIESTSLNDLIFCSISTTSDFAFSVV